MDDIQSANVATEAENASPAEQTTEAPSTSAEETTQDNAQTSEKTINTEDIDSSGSLEDQKEAKQMIPIDRLNQEIEKRRDAEQRAALLDEMKKNPNIAQAFLKESGVPNKPVDPNVTNALNVLKEHGIPTLDDVQQLLDQREAKSKEEAYVSKVQDNFNTQVSQLSSKYDGSDGTPKFDAQAVADYMDTHGYIRDDGGMPDVETTFMMMNKEAFIDAQARKAKSTTFTEKPTQPMSSGNANNSAGKIAEAKRTGDFSGVFGSYLKNPFRS